MDTHYSDLDQKMDSQVNDSNRTCDISVPPPNVPGSIPLNINSPEGTGQAPNLMALVKKDYFGEAPSTIKSVVSTTCDTNDKMIENKDIKLGQKKNHKAKNRFDSILTSESDNDLRFRTQSLQSIVANDGKEYFDHWTVNYCAGGEDIEGVLVLDDGILTFNATRNIEVSVNPVKVSSKKSNKSSKDKNVEKTLGNLQAVINVHDIDECTLMAVPIPCAKHCHKNDTVHLFQLTLCNHGEMPLAEQLDETITSMRAKKIPYASVYFNIKPECGNTGMNKESIKALTQLLNKIQAAKQSMNMDREEYNQKTNLPYFELLTRSFQSEHADNLRLSRQLITKHFNTKLIEFKTNINSRAKESSAEEKSPQIMKKQRKLIVPNTQDQSDIISMEQLGQILSCVPDLYQMFEWKLLYSTVQHGTSFNTLMRRVSSTNPFLIIAKDYDGNILGAYGSAKLRFSQDYYGTPETFLFTFKKTKKIQDFQWSKKNDMFIFTNDEGIMFGTGPFYGLWIGSELTRGRTYQCETFNNEPLTDTTDFEIARLEAWGISNSLSKFN